MQLSEEPAGGDWRVSAPGAGPPRGGEALLLGGGLACFSGLLSCWLIPLSADTGDSLFWIPDPGLPPLPFWEVSLPYRGPLNRWLITPIPGGVSPSGVRIQSPLLLLFLQATGLDCASAFPCSAVQARGPPSHGRAREVRSAHGWSQQLSESSSGIFFPRLLLRNPQGPFWGLAKCSLQLLAV